MYFVMPSAAAVPTIFVGAVTTLMFAGAVMSAVAADAAAVRMGWMGGMG